MARHVKEVLEELFKGRDAALEKYAKVRMVQYEMNLWRIYHLPLPEVSKQAKIYFSKRFLNGQSIATASEKELKEAFERLDHAVKDGCHGRCERLVKELNEALEERGIKGTDKIEEFLNWLTFSYHTVDDGFGGSKTEPGYGFEIRIFDSDDNRKALWAELQFLLKSGCMMSMYEAASVAVYQRKHAKTLE